VIHSINGHAFDDSKPGPILDCAWCGHTALVAHIRSNSPSYLVGFYNMCIAAPQKLAQYVYWHAKDAHAYQVISGFLLPGYSPQTPAPAPLWPPPPIVMNTPTTPAQVASPVVDPTAGVSVDSMMRLLLGGKFIKKKCECGSAKAMGAKDFGPGHSDWCPVAEASK